MITHLLHHCNKTNFRIRRGPCTRWALISLEATGRSCRVSSLILAASINTESEYPLILSLKFRVSEWRKMKSQTHPGHRILLLLQLALALFDFFDLLAFLAFVQFRVLSHECRHFFALLLGPGKLLHQLCKHTHKKR